MYVSSSKSHFQSPRISFVWITVAQIVCTLPHILYIPKWVSGLCVWCVFWRWMVYQGRWSYPSKYARYGMVILAIFGLMLYYPKLLSIQAAVTLLIITYYMKLLEMFRLKDVYVVLILSYFVMASAFLFREDILMSVYFVIAFLLTTVALVSSNRTDEKLRKGGSFKQGLILCVQAVPIGLCLFLFFPRFDPFWSLDMKKDGPSIGLSESMSPADIAELGAAEGVAFRVEFEGDIPSPKDRYWRVLTLSSFDGVKWASLFSSIQSQLVFAAAKLQGELLLRTKSQGERYVYRVSLEPTQQNWLPTLDRPMAISVPSVMMPDFSLLVEKPIATVKAYQGESSPAALLDLEINDWVRNRNIELPMGFNNKSIEYAQDTFQRLDNNHQRFIEHVLHLFREEAFYYTLKPGQYGKNSVDEFLFGRRKGFCAHYASAMAVLLRSVGIPTRVVIGYHGGEINPLGGHLVIHQYEAHAWVEAWVSGQGWVRYDPTAMVAPWRLILGIEQMMQQSSTSEVPSLQNSLLRSSEFANTIRLLLDYSNYRWNKYVVNFDKNYQRQVLERVFDDVSLRKMIILMMVAIFSVLAVIAAAMFWRSRVRFPCRADRYLMRLLRGLEKKYHTRPTGMTLQTYIQQLQQKVPPAEYERLQTVVRLYSKWAYEPLAELDKKKVLRLFLQEARQATRTVNHLFK